MKGSREVSILLSDSLMRFLVAPSSFLAWVVQFPDHIPAETTSKQAKPGSHCAAVCLQAAASCMGGGEGSTGTDLLKSVTDRLWELELAGLVDDVIAGVVHLAVIKHVDRTSRSL